MVFLLRSVGRYAGAACALIFAASCVFAQASNPSDKNTPTVKVAGQQAQLPQRFSAWVATGTPRTGTAPAEADPANADVLTEYGLKDFAANTYHRDGSTANVRALRFADATGAYGAFTFYRRPNMKPVAIGNGGASDGHQTIFWTGATMVQATSDASASQLIPSLTALSRLLPPAGATSGVAPSLPDHLPLNSLDKATVRYAIGPTAYTRSGGVLPPNAIDFSRDAEVVTAQYSAHNGPGTLTLIEYPTPQMAIGSERTLNALLKGPLPATLQQSNPAALSVRRTGPLVAVTSGDFSSAEAQALLDHLQYKADVTFNRAGNSSNEVKKAANLLVGIAYLTAILGISAILLAAFLGGGRAIWRVMRGKPASTVYEEEFSCLNLSGWMPESPRKLH